MLVPSAGDKVRVRPITGSVASANPTARCNQRGDGYEMRIDLPLPAAGAREIVEVDLVINEAPNDRVRRRGQLVTKDAHGQFVYLRGDREEPGASLRVELVK